MQVRIKKLHEKAEIPRYMSELAAGFDLTAVENHIIPPNGSAIVGTGIAFELSEGYEMQIRGRSGLGFKHDILCFIGTVDADYRGEVRAKLFNLGREPFHVEIGFRVAQGVLSKVERATFELTDGELSSTRRGADGYGHTGLQ